MEKYILTAEEIAALPGLDKTHFLNPKAKRNNKSLGDLTGLTGLGFHLIEVPPGCESTEFHVHAYEDECVYVLEGEATVIIGDESTVLWAGSFIGYRAGGLPHSMKNTGTTPLRCLVAGERRAHEVGDYPKQKKRLFMNQDRPWELVDWDCISHPGAGRKT